MEEVLRTTNFAMRQLPNPPKNGERVLQTAGREAWGWAGRSPTAGEGCCVYVALSVQRGQVGGCFFALVDVLLLAMSYAKGRKGRSTPALAMAVRPLQCFARTVTKSGFRIIDVIPGKTGPRVCSPAPRRLIRLTQDGTCLHVNRVKFRRT